MRPRLLTLALALLTPVTLWAQEESPFAPYPTVVQAHELLEALARANPDKAALIQYGESAGGRPLLALRIALPGPLDPDARPAVFVGANACGYHHAGTSAALHLAETLLGSEPPEGIDDVTFLVAPIVNPDAHDALFTDLRWRREGNDQTIDRDRDGEVDEDGIDDLDGDGRRTWLRIPDPTGGWLPDPRDPRLMVRPDAREGRRGTHRVLREGSDQDGDGEHDEDGVQGVHVDKNFAHAFPYPAAEAGPWASYAPEAKAVMDFLLARRNVQVAVVYGPANNLLALPERLGRGGGGGGQVELKGGFAGMLGMEPGSYSIDRVWEVAKSSQFVKRNGVDKDRLAQILGGGAATSLAGADKELLEALVDDYEQRLEEAGQSPKRPGRQYGKGGFTPWLYYHYGALALELDVWGIPPYEPDGEEEDGLSLKTLGEMDKDALLALDDAELQALLEEIGAPDRITPARLKERVEAGLSPEQLVKMLERLKKPAKGEDDEETKRAREVLNWLSDHQDAFVAPWVPVTLPDGTAAEAGGLDPHAGYIPPRDDLEPAVQAHTQTVLDLARKLARVELSKVEVEDLGAGVYRLDVVASNRGWLPTHTKQAVRARNHLPLRLEVELGDATLVSGKRWRSTERLDAGETLEATWLLRAPAGTTVTVRLNSQNAGTAAQAVTLGGPR